jgi:hypothetical protein
MSRRRLTASLAGLAAAVATSGAGVPAARAAGGGSIAAAPTLPFGVLVSGGGQPDHQYYRVPLFGGDRLTLDLDKQASDCSYLDLSLFQPSVTDYQVGAAEPVDTTKYLYGTGKQEIIWNAPFTGGWILEVKGVPECGIEPFTLIATPAHRTAVVVHAPSLARRGSTIAVQAAVQSPAGQPTGSCLIAGSSVPVVAGQCAGRLRLGRGRRQTVRVEFVPDEGWLASAGRRVIRLAGGVRPHRSRRHRRRRS